MVEEFNYNDLWKEEETKIERVIQKEVIPNLPKGRPRQGVNVYRRFRVKK